MTPASKTPASKTPASKHDDQLADLRDPAFQNESCRVFVDDGIATVVLAMPGHANLVDLRLARDLSKTLDYLLAGATGLAGIIIGSAHSTFCVGADLNYVYDQQDGSAVLAMVQHLGAVFRRLETCGLPVVAALTGSALGGGYELALACHHRIAVDDPKIQLGLPEVSLGLIPGGGGTQRLPRILGTQPALELMVQGRMLRPAAALKQGLVDALATDADDLAAQAVTWIRANPTAVQPWDQKHSRWPGGAPDSDLGRNIFMAASAMLFSKTAGAFPATQQLLAVVQEGGRLVFDRGLEVEARAFCALAVSDQAKDMMRTFFFHRKAADAHLGLPALAPGEDPGFRKVAVLGAGMMGAGLAFVAARRGYSVVLRDISQDALDLAMARARLLAVKQLRNLPIAQQQAVVQRITPTLDLQDVAGCDLVIEAIVEDLAIKQQVIAQVQPLLAPDAVFASNTSALPISALAQYSGAPDRFIGLHFFSPVEQMPLIEIVVSEQTSERTVARALAFARKTRKTPIVVNDGYGFYTTRVFSAYILEGAQLVAEGHDPRLVEWGARQAGMVVGPLQVFDEVTLSLGRHVLADARRYVGASVDIPGAGLVDAMVAAGRLGKAHGGGFYDYDEDGRRLGLWTGLAAVVAQVVAHVVAQVGAQQDPTRDGDPVVLTRQLGRRLLLAQCAEVLRRMDQGVIQRPRDAEVGAIFGIGFAPNTGGPLALMDRIGLPALETELDALADAHGERFRPAPLLRAMAQQGQRFFDA